MTENSLVIMEQAARMLTEADTVQKAKDLKDLALTAADWARRKGLGEQAIQHAREYAFRAERKMGEMLDPDLLSKGSRGQLKGKDPSGGYHVLPPEDDNPTLADLGLTKRESSHAQALALLPEDEFERVATGEKTVTQVKREMIQNAVVEKIKDLPSGKHVVIYADPPWEYHDKQGGSISNGYGAAEKHYPCMALSDLKALAVEELAADDAVLFLWVTSPLLPSGLELAKAWGFAYKTFFVWDKVKHNMGHYSSVRHECLLVCVRGSCQPQVRKLFDSVQTIERTETHSEKPEEFREIIDTIYPHGRRIELFARKAVDGWVTWGAEAERQEAVA